MTTDLVGIGAVIAELSEEFPELTVSKVRFLEAQGLLAPVRTPSGYRRYSTVDRERLRYILSTQRDHFLPLRVIAEHLEAMSRGLAPPDIVDPTPRPPVAAGDQTVAAGVTPTDSPVRLSEAELLRESGLTATELADAAEQGLLAAGSDGRYGLVELSAARAIRNLADYGASARHLRAIRLAAERHIGFADQLVHAAGRDVAAQRTMAAEVLRLTSQVESAVVAAHVASAYPDDR